MLEPRAGDRPRPDGGSKVRMAPCHGGTLRHEGGVSAERGEKIKCAHRHQKEIMSPSCLLPDQPCGSLPCGSVLPIVNVASSPFSADVSMILVMKESCVVADPSHRLEAMRPTPGPCGLALGSHKTRAPHYLMPTLCQIMTFMAMRGQKL